MHITVVIPTYNRKANLELVLWSLCAQSSQGFTVVVSDDGSTDCTKAAVRSFKEQNLLDIHYIRQEHTNYRVSLARNRGVLVAPTETTHILFLDSDVMLSPRAIEHYYWMLMRMPEGRVVCGKYEWLPPMLLDETYVRSCWTSIVKKWALFYGLLRNGYLEFIDPNIPTKEKTPFVGGNFGTDPREPKSWFDCLGEPVSPRTITLSGNLLVPLEVLRATGGFDEKVESQGQDCEFSYNLCSHGYTATLCGHAYGLHLYHPRDPEADMAGARWTLEYIRKKYNEGVPLPTEVIKTSEGV